jgi:hypothetical protein
LGPKSSSPNIFYFTVTLGAKQFFIDKRAYLISLGYVEVAFHAGYARFRHKDGWTWTLLIDCSVAHVNKV